MINILIETNEGLISQCPEYLTFSGGEEHIRLERYDIYDNDRPIIINAQITSSIEVMRLLLITDSLRELYINPIELWIPYIPYARQDRVCVDGDAFSLRVFANIINSMDYSAVRVVDAHSNVAIDLLNNVIETKQYFMVPFVNSRLRSIDYIISPDAGAKNKAKEWVNEWNKIADKKAELVQAFKVRDDNGNIVNTEIEHDNFNGGSCLIVDDICDGGRTFFELSRVLRDRGAGNVYLYVTHGIFSKGIKATGCDKVFTTNSLPEKDDGRIVVRRFF